MKKRGIVSLLLAGTMLFTAGCSTGGKKEISNEYIKISQYKDLEVEKVEQQKVSDKEVQNYIDSIMSTDTKEVKDRPLKKGDIAKFDYVGKLKSTGEVFDEGSLSLGNGESYVPGFEDGIYGHDLNETFDVELTFPEGYGGSQKPELSNAEVIFTIKITSIEEKVTAKLTDDFVKKVSKKSKTVKEYKEEVRKMLEKSSEQTAKATLRDATWNELMSKVELVKYPEDQLKEKEKMMDDQMQMVLAKSYQISLDDYLKETGLKKKDYDKQITEAAKEYLKQVLAVQLIAKEEGLELSEKQYTKAIEKLAKENGYPDSKTLLDTLGEVQVKDAVLQNKVVDWLVDHCKLVEPKKESSKDTDGNK